MCPDPGSLAFENSDQMIRFNLFRFLSGKNVQFHLSRKNHRKFHSNGKRSLTSFLKFQASGIQQRVDPRIAEKIHYLVGKGIITVNEMRRHAREYLTNDLFCGQELPPTYNRRFWPSRKDHRNHIYRAIVANRFSKLNVTRGTWLVFVFGVVMVPR